MLAQIEELSTLVGDLVDLTRDDAGEVVHEPVDMSEVIDRSLERVRRRRNDIHFDVDVMPWQVYGDSAGLSRAALNLMDNAAKWSPPGGHVGVRMRQLDASHAELVVSDHGPGIPPHERAWCSSGSTGRRRRGPLPGSGLGLAIVKQVVLNHGGRCASKTPFRVASRRERRFTCCFPVGRCRVRRTRRPAPECGCGGQRSQRPINSGELSGFERTLSQWTLSPRGQGSCS